MKFNATNLNLDSNDSNNVVKLTQIRLYSTIDFINFSIWFIIQMISIKKIQNSFESNNFKQSRSKNVHFEFIEKKFSKWKFEYYIESFKTDYFFYSDKLKEKGKKKKWKNDNMKTCFFFLLMAFVRDHFFFLIFLRKNRSFETLYLVFFLSDHWSDYICSFEDFVANHQFYTSLKRIPVNDYLSLISSNAIKARIDQRKYQKKIDNFMYAMIAIRSDITFVIKKLNQFC